MATSALSSQERAADAGGLRHVHLRRDLSAIADLIEIAFAPTMDIGGRAAVEDMRALSRIGAFIWLLALFDPAIRALSQGFVWVDPGTQALVGNVSLYGTGYDSSLVIANVATHPDYRRRGIARMLLERALDYAVEKNAACVLLQVEADNLTARRLYERLGFREQRAFIRWRWRPYLEAPERLRRMPDITLRTGRDWKAELALAEAVRPNSQGGLGWLQPTLPHTFHQSLARHLFNFARQQHWIIRDPEHPERLLAAMLVENPFAARYSRASLMVASGYENELVLALINFALRTVADHGRGLVVEHPADDKIARAVFAQYDFEATRHLVHMQWNPER